MSFRHGIFSNIRLGNQGESANEKREENGERAREGRNSRRPKGASLSPPAPDHSVLCPSFSENHERREAVLIKVIHTLLIGFPEFFIEYPKEHFKTINELVSESSWFSEKAAFEKPEDCLKFFQQRRFLFRKHPEDKHYRNTEFAHRKTVGEFVRFVQKKTSTTRCTLKDLVEWQKNKRRNEYSYNFSIEELVRKLVEVGYPEFFWTKKGHFDVFVGLKQLAYEIPSLWSENVLPEIPTEPFCDRSQTGVFLAKIFHSCYGYKGKIMKAIIYEKGLYENSFVHFFEEYPTDLSKITKIIPEQSDAFVYVYRVFGCSYRFFGIRAVPVPREDLERNLVDKRKMELIARGDFDYEQVSADSSTSYDRDKYAPLDDLIAAEKSVIKFVDEIVGGLLLTKDSFVEKLLAQSDWANYEHFFRDPQDAWEFVYERPHRYYFNGYKAWVRSPMERTAFNAIFGFLNDNANEGKTIEEISRAVIAVGYQGSVEDLIGTLDSVLTVTKDSRWMCSSCRQGKSRTSYYFLKAYFDEMEQTLLPGYPIPPFPVRRT